MQIQMSPKVLLDIERGLAPQLHNVLWGLITIWPANLMRITSIYRAPEYDRILKEKTVEEYKRGIHTVGPPYRALDVGVTDLGPDWPNKMVELAHTINSSWIYDPERPEKVVCYIKPHGTGPHIHLQTHHSTERWP